MTYMLFLALPPGVMWSLFYFSFGPKVHIFQVLSDQSSQAVTKLWRERLAGNTNFTKYLSMPNKIPPNIMFIFPTSYKIDSSENL